MEYTFLESSVEPVLTSFSRFDTCAVDIETTGLNPWDSRMVMFQIGFPDHQFVIDTRKVSIQPILPFLSSWDWKKLLFNGKFDEQFILHEFNTPILNIHDCMLAELVLHPEQRWNNSFEDVALRRLGVTLNKSIRKTFANNNDFTEEQIQYGAEDVKYLFPVYEQQLTELTEKKSKRIMDLENRVQTVVSNMELTGVPVNKEKWREVLFDYKEQHNESRKKLLSMLVHQPVEEFVTQTGLFEDDESKPSVKAPNLGSPKQLVEALGKVGINVTDTKEETLAKIDRPEAKELLVYRGLDKVLTSYGDSVLNRVHPFTGRIHANWKQLGTETGRFACKDPNLQQLPPRLRKCVGGESNYVLLGADFSQMELRILAQESKDPALISAFAEGKDIHTATASSMFGLPFDKISKDQRFTAKTLNFGITYGMGPEKFMNMMNAEALKDGKQSINMAQSAALIERYKNTYKVASSYLQQVGLGALRNGYVRTRFGRNRYFNPVSNTLDPKSYKAQIGAIKREGANMPIQGTNADITKLSMIAIHEELQEYGFKANIILQVHDELVLLTHKTQLDVIQPIVVESMVKAGQSILPDVPIVVEAYASEYWAK